MNLPSEIVDDFGVAISKRRSGALAYRAERYPARLDLLKTLVMQGVPTDGTYFAAR